MNYSVIQKVIGKFKRETSNFIWIDEFVFVQIKTFSLDCNCKNTNKLKFFQNHKLKLSSLKNSKNC